MPPLGRKFEAPALTNEEVVLRTAVHNKGNEVRVHMKLLLPYRGMIGPRKTKSAEYHAGGEASDTRERAWLQRAGKHSYEPIQLMLSSVTMIQSDGGVEWPIQTLATIDSNGHLIDDKYHEFFPAQRLAFLEEVLSTVAIIELQVPPEPIQRLGQTAIGS